MNECGDWVSPVIQKTARGLMVLKFQFLNKWWFPGYMGCCGISG